MADNEENANLVVSAVNEATQTLQEVQKSLEDFEGSAGSLGVTSVALGGILKDVLLKAFEQLKEVVKLGINEAIDAEQQQVKLANAFKAEGAEAQTSIKSINAMADKLGALVGIDNDVIVATAATLRQLGGLSAEMINQAMPAITDLATRTGSLESAAMTVTRAMNGQTRQLRLLGIDFEATGNKGKDLEVLLGKINEKFGGQAEANMKTTGGQIQNLKVVFTDVAQSIGEGLIQSDAFQSALKLIKGTLEGIKRILGDIKPPDPTYTNDAEGRDKQRLDLMKQRYAAEDGLNTLLKEKKDLEQADPNLIGDYTAINAGIEKQAQLVRNLKLAEDDAAQKRKKAHVAEIAISSSKKVLTEDEIVTKEKETQEFEKQEAAKDLLLRQAYERRTGLKSAEFEADIQWNGLSLIANQDLADRIIQSAEDTEVKIDEVKQRHRQQQLLMEEMYAAELQQLSSAIANTLASTMGQSLYNIVAGTGNSLTALKQLWHDFGNSVLRMLTEMIARVILFNTLTSLSNLGSGGIFGFFGKMASGIFSGHQTAEGSTRVIPGPPNLAVPILAHGGETIGRGGSSGGDTIIIEGDYFASEEADAKLFDRQYKYKKRNGLS